MGPWWTGTVASADIQILSSENDILNLHTKWPAIAIIPGSYDADKERGTVNKQMYLVDCWVMICELAHGKTIQDMTDVETVHTLVKSVNDIVAEQNEDSAKKLANLVDFVHPVNCNPSIYENHRHGDIYAAIVKVEAELLAS